MSPSEDIRREDLWSLYRTAIDDRNFQVQLNWDRTKHYFIFNVALFSIAAGLAHFEGPFRAPQLAVLLLAILNSLIASYAIVKGHRYYRQSRKRLKQIELDLGLIDSKGSAYAMQTTDGMVRETEGHISIPFAQRFTITNLNVLLQLYIAAASSYAFVRLLWSP